MSTQHLAAYIKSFAQLDPTRIAIKSAETVVSYQELDHESNRIANFFDEKTFRGASSEPNPNLNVCVMLDRSAEIITVIIGLLKTGMVFVPLSPHIPEKRIELLLKETQTRWIVTSPEYCEKFRELFSRKNEVNVLTVEDFKSQSTELQFEMRYNKYCYIYFTSGSTGIPKGVLGRHKSLHHFIDWEINEFSIDSTFNVSQLTQPTFDPYLRDIFVPLLAGGTLCIPDYETLMNPADLIKWINTNKIGLIHIVPSLFKLISIELDNPENLLDLKYILLAGELLRGNDIRKFIKIFNDRIQLVNIYGPTETTLAKFFYLIQPKDVEKSIIPVGKTIKGAEAFILDEQRQKVLIGNIGEIYIRTPYISSGYYNNKERNKDVFIQNPFSAEKNDIIYKTGDMGKLLFDGNVELIGRVDGQVKIRGHRVETGEVENLLLNVNYIKEAVVIDKEDQHGEKYLCAFLVLEKGSQQKKLPDLQQLKQMLAKHLPAHMLPSYFIPLDEIPLTPNGKIDKKALPTPETSIVKDDTYVAPQNDVEKKVIEIWSHILSLPQDSIGIDDNFFQLGGHSLKAITMASKIHQHLNVQVPLAEIFKNSTTRLLAEYIGGEAAVEYKSINPAEEKEYYNLSSSQRRLYFLQQLEPRSTAYNIPLSIPLAEEVSVAKLEDALKALINRHDSLRTSFHMVNNVPMQRIDEYLEFKIKTIDLTVLLKDAFYNKDKINQINLEGSSLIYDSSPFQNEDSTKAIINSFIQPFDLSQPPLMRVGLLKTKNAQSYLLVDLHHIITDGISQIVLSQDLMSLYEGKVLPLLRIQYKDFVEWQSINKKEGKIEQQEVYWLKEFEGEIPVLNIPNDYPRPAFQSLEGSNIDFEISQEMTRRIIDYTGEKKITLFIFLLAITNILLSKLSGQEDIIIGTTVAGRTHADLEKIIGMFVNALALRNFPIGEKKVSEFLNELKKRTLDVFENQDYPFEDLVSQLALDRNMGRNPLFDVMLVLQNFDPLRSEEIIMGVGKTEMADNSVPVPQEYTITSATSKFDLTITAWERSQGLQFTFQYCTKLFKMETIQRFRHFFCQIISTILQNDENKICEISIITEEDKKRILYQFNDSVADYPKSLTIHQLFDRQVEKTPHRIAVVGPSPLFMQISYAELNEDSNSIATMLRERGVTCDTIVGIMVERSIEMISGLLGILKAGGAYLPIDPDYPQERVDFILKDSAAAVFLTTNQLTECFQNKPICSVEPVAIHSQSSHSLAYIIYTSGTTGNPKGVLVEHQNVVRLMTNDKFQFDFGIHDVWTMFHSFNFDFSVWEMYGALLYGGKLIIVPKMVSRDPSEFLEILKREQVTVLNQTPSAFYNLIDEEKAFGKKELNIRYVIFGGEALKPIKLVYWREKYPATKLINMFGITETTVHVTYKEIGDNEIAFNISNIGVPIPTMSTYVVDKYLNLLPLGVTGELLVGGDGVSRGYLNRPELTAERFIPNLFRENERIYRSGDLALFFTDGEMKYLGRMDHQVQLKGFRIELGEIENRLLHFSGITEAVVTVKENTEADYKYLCAYFVAQENVDINTLRKFLTEKLPDYMIPQYFIPMTEIPLTVNGKINHARLPEPISNVDIDGEYVAPVDQIQSKLVEIWQQALQVDQVGIKDNYFNLGGDSIKAIALVSAINNAFQSNLKIVDLYTNQNIEGLSTLLKEKETRQQDYFDEILAEIELLKNRIFHIVNDPNNIQDVFPMSDIEKGMVFHYLKDSATSAYNNQALYQLIYKDFNVERMIKAFHLIMEKHPILRTAYIEEEFAHVVYKHVPMDFKYYDIAAMDKPSMEVFIKQRMMENRNKRYDVEVAPLWRVTFFNTGIQDFVLILWEVHHAIVDGWSNSLLLPELDNTYLELERNPDLSLPKLKSGYKEYILQEMADKRNPEIANYWKNEFSEYKRLVFPGKVDIEPENNRRKIEINTIRLNLGMERRQKLEDIAKSNHTTLKHLCFAANALMLNMLSYENDIVIGLVTNNRPLCEDGDKIIGCFLNTIPVRIIIPDHISGVDFIKTVDKKMLEVKKYDRLSLFEILMHLGEKTSAQNPVMDTLFNYTDFYAFLGSQSLEKVKDTETFLNIENYEKNNFSFNLSINTLIGNLAATFVYSTTFGDDYYGKKMGDYFCRILDLFITNPDVMINKGIVMSPEEREQLLFDFNKTEVAYPHDKNIHQLFEKQVEKNPEHIAIVGPSLMATGEKNAAIQILYNELNEKANRLSRSLQKRGIDTHNIVAIMTEPCIEMLVGILAVLKCGACYLPIDPMIPEGRIEYLLRDSDAKLLLKSPHIGDEINVSIEMADLTDERLYAHDPSEQYKIVKPETPVYIIYTSGTTGNPKGVQISHMNLVNYVHWLSIETLMTSDDRSVLTSSFSFDLGNSAIYPALVCGFQVHLLSKEMYMDPEIMLNYIFNEKITYLKMTPSQFSTIANAHGFTVNMCRSLRLVMLGGEAIITTDVEKAYQVCNSLRIMNEYGPTEATVGCIAQFIERSDLATYKIKPTIGLPIFNTKVYILDKFLNLVPIGIAGELCLGGAGLTTGYFKREELSREKFVELDYNGNQKIYRTGDWARRLIDGNIEFLGRIDHQLKIRGFRVELGEIENCLLSYPGIKEAVVLAHGDDARDKTLCAYLVSEREYDFADLQKFLLKQLPDYMIPSYFIPLEKLPLTFNGKVDRKALPKPELKAELDHVPPRNAMEAKLVVLWAELLNIQPEIISIDSNFFQLGGHSLKATVLASRVHREFNVIFPLAELFKSPTIRGLSEYIMDTVENIYESILPAEEKEYYTLSFAQKRMYILQQIDLNSTAYNMPQIIPLLDEMDIEGLTESFKKLIQRHESLRTSFHMISDQPQQRVHREVAFQIGRYDTSDFHRFVRVFDLSCAPLLRVGSFKTVEDKHFLMVDMHHIISDGVSSQVLSDDFMALYKGKELPRLRIQYKDFAQWQNSPKEINRIHKQMEYWLKEFEGEIPLIEIPTDYSRPISRSFEGNRIAFQIGIEESRGLQALAMRGGATLFMVLVAAINILLSKLSGQEEIIIGTPTAGRRHADLEKIIGMFVNTLALKNYPAGELTFKEFLYQIKERALMVFEHQEYPFEELVDKLSLKRDMARNPIFDVLFVLQNMNPASALQDEEPKAAVQPIQSESQQEYDQIAQKAKFDLTFNAMEIAQGTLFSIQYCTQLFKQETIERFITYFKKILSSILMVPEIRIADIDVMSEEERKQILYDYNNTDAEYPKDKTVHQLFETQVEKTPEHVALIGSSIFVGLPLSELVLHISYKVLNEKSNQMAYWLQEKGVVPNTIVAIMVERSIETIIDILGTLKAGATYLPIDPDYPQDRINYMLEDSNAKITLTQDLIIDTQAYTPPNSLAQPHHTANIIYTSGSTGKPKGVMVEHASIVNLVSSQKQFFNMNMNDRVIQFSTLCFDASVEQIFISLSSGAVLVLIDKNTLMDNNKFETFLTRERITHLHAVPSFLTQLNPDYVPNIKRFISGGDICPTHLAKKWFNQCDFYNEYGPTETTVTSIEVLIREINETLSSLPIGRPIGNTEVFLFDRWMKLVPIGVIGELYIGGVGVARGYLNQPELTYDKFFSIPINSPLAKKIYKTGDLARWLPDGNIEFLGRMDHQVKLRGFRIELGEIENRLLKYPGLKEAVLVALEEKDGEGSYLCAYIVSDQEYEVAGLRDFLLKGLPDYMIPSYFVRLEKIPLTANGKLNRKALPSPEVVVDKNHVPPRDRIEVKLVELWADVLNIQADVIGIDGNFFQLGGHSLKATVLASKIHRELNITLPLAELFRNPTIRHLSEYIKGKNEEFFISIEPTEEKDYYALSPAQKRLYFLQQFMTESTGYNMPYVIPMGGDVDKEKLEAIFKRLIARHDGLRTSFITVGDVPMQRINPTVDFSLEPYEVESELAAFHLISGFLKPFDLSKAPLLRVNLVTIGSSRQLLALDMHHIITDGTSQDILEKEFKALLMGEEPAPLRLQYKDYSEWYNSPLQQEVIKNQEAYWFKEFGDEIPVLNLPTDYPRPLVQNFEGNVVVFSFNKKEVEVIKAIVQNNDATLYMGILAIFNVLLAKLSGHEDIIVGTPIAARRHADLEKVVGMLVNTLAMRNYPQGEKTFKEFLSEVRERTLGAYENQDYPFEMLVDHLTVKRDTGRNPVFDVMFNFLNQADFHGDITQSQENSSYKHMKGTAKFDLNFAAQEIGDWIRLSFEYSSNLFKPDTIERMIGYLKNIVSVLSKDAGTKISSIEIMGEAEKEDVLRLSRGGESFYEGFETIHGLFAEQVERTPDNIALVGPSLNAPQHQSFQITYRQLNEKSDQLARILRSNGVDRDITVGLMVERSIEMIICILAIMKAGGAYLPIDPEYPQERIDYMMKDSHAVLVLTGHDVFQDSDYLPVVPAVGKSSDLVYVIYTSGSTGKPKGVMLEHLNLVNLIKHHFEYTNLDCSRVLQFSTISFDVSFQEIFSTFLSGGQLFLVSKATRTDIPEFFKLVNKNRISTLFLPISFLKVIFKEEEFISQIPLCIRHIQTAGEQVVINEKFRKYLKERKVFLHNHYGPAETHVVTILTIDPEGEIPGLPTIGKPILNTGIYIVDKNHNLLPMGATGELWIGGLQVGRGYWEKEELTREKFFPNPFVAGERLYKSGDLGRWTSDGNIEFLGRIDNQVKIRGFRVELGEIERQLSCYHGITESVVVAGGDVNEGRYLIAYFVSNGELGVSELRERLSKDLPDYMIPSYFVQLEKMPLTPNGKVDRRVLPKPEIKAQRDHVAPRNPTEVKLVELWADVLNIQADVIGIDGNFFQLGGHSLKATVLASKIHRELNITLPLAELFRNPTIRHLSEYIKGKNKEFFISIEPTEEKDYYALSPAQKRLYFLQQFMTESTGYNMPYVIPMGGDVDKEKLEAIFKRLIARHDGLRTSFITVGDVPMQRINPTVDFSLESYEVESELAAFHLISGFLKPFDLSKAPLLRVNLVTIGSSRQLLALDMHHIITDGTSQDILEKEFKALLIGEEPTPLQLQYKDYSEWYNSPLQQEVIKNQETYWFKEFGDEIPVLNLPTDYPRPLVQNFEGNVVVFSFTKKEVEVIKAIVQNNDATLYMGILAIFNVLLAKLSGHEDIIVGTPIAARRHADLEKVVGMLVNTLAMRNYPQGEKTFKEFLSEVRERTLGAYENQDYPFEMLVDHLTVKRDTGRNPVFDVMFNFLNQADFHGNITQSQENSSYKHMKGTAKFDLNFAAQEIGDWIRLSFEYSSNLFKPDTIERMIGYLKNIVSVLSKDAGTKISSIEIMGEAEKEDVLRLSRGEESFYEGFETIHGLFAEQVERTPENIAIVGPSLNAPQHLSFQITYRQLNEKSDQLARILRSKGVDRDITVGLMVERSIEMIICILAIMKAGGAYLPIDPEYPQDRIDYMMKDSHAVMVLTGHEDFQNSDGLPPIPAVGKNSDLVYVIYTSGSTGKPKGVMLEHLNLVNLMKHHFEYTNLDCSRVLQFSTISFDVSFHEIFSTFLSGGQLFLVSKETRTDIPELFKLVNRNRISTLFLPISFLKVIFKEEEFINQIPMCIRHIQTAGEQVVINDRFRKYLKERKVYLHNHYGPAETHVVTVLTIEPEGEIPGLPTIGKPILNTGIYIVDKNNNLLPMGATGELWIGGLQVGRGYWEKEELTREKFFPNPFVAGERLYKSGDLGRWTSDGNIEFLGRIDNQVKIRGFRVELGEIERQLSCYHGITESVVVAGGDVNEGRYLIAYFVSNGELGVSELRERLSKDLPDYMIPSYFVPLEKMPLTPNGKVDRRVLPKPEIKAQRDHVVPRNPTEVKLVELWADVLNIQADVIGIDGNFFQLGGHSLKATVLASKIHKEMNVLVPLAELFKTPTIRGLSEYIRGTVENIYLSILPTEEKEFYVLSFAQQRMYILQQIDIHNTAYNMPQIIPILEEIDQNRMTDAFKKLIQRHESLRTSFHMVDDQPQQKIHQEVAFQIEKYETTDAHRFVRAFDLSCAPLLRVGQYKTVEGMNCLMVDMHHIISDGVSNHVLREDFQAFYEGKELPPLRLQYKDFALWQNSEKEITRINQQLEYWLKELAGEIPLLAIHTDYPRGLNQSFEGDSLDFQISDEDTRALNNLALQGGATLFMVLMATINILLSKLSSQEEIIIGTPIAGRRHADLEKIIGMFVNTLVLKSYPAGERTFKQFLDDTKERVLLIFENQEYPFEGLVDKLSIKRDMGRNPLFDVLFVLQNMNADSPDVENENLDNTKRVRQQQLSEEYRTIAQTVKFDLTFTAREMGQKIFFSIQYATKLFKRETIQRFIAYFQQIIANVLNQPEMMLADIDLITDQEKKQILYHFNNTEADYPKHKTIPQLFAEQVLRTPDHIALVATTSQLDNEFLQQITYRELHEKSDHLAYFIREKGINPDAIVGVMVERSIEMILGILGILKSGGAYMPIDPGYPQDRIDFMLKDSGATLVLTREFIIIAPPPTPSMPLVPCGHSHGLAYIIYTSGSTGKPKGVLVEHQNVIRLVKNTNYVKFNVGDKMLQTGALSFDASTFEVWGSLLNGLELFLLPNERVLNPEALRLALHMYAISTIWMTAPLFNQMVDADEEIFNSLKNLLVGGDVLSVAHINRMLRKSPGLNIINGYGPTENTTFSTTYPITQEYLEKIPIGKPIHNSTAYIVDKRGQLLPIAIAGELWVGGDGVARGYLNNPELTHLKFMATPNGPVYRTGDLARWLPDGNIEFLGRIDQQVKIRGFRIELGEIENCLLKFPGIKETVVLARQDAQGDKSLCAYFVSHEENNPMDLRDFLLRQLPDYMIPAYFVPMERIPLNPNGKVDRNMLPMPELKATDTYSAASNEIEAKLVALWAEILGRDPAHAAQLQMSIGIDDNFFQLGGHSLKATVLTSKIHKLFDVKVSLGEIFRTPRIRDLAQYIKGKSTERYMSIEPAEEKEYYILSSAQNRMYFLQRLAPNSVDYNMAVALSLTENFEMQKVNQVFLRLIERHESLRTSFHMINQQPVQKIHRHFQFRIESQTVTGSEEEVNKLTARLVKPFDLTQAPLLRAVWINWENRHLLWVDMHHIISDGVSMEVLNTDFIALYGGKTLPPLRLQYKDFAEWQNNPSQQQVIKQQEKYWLDQFAGQIPRLNLSNVIGTPVETSVHGSGIRFGISKEETTALRELAFAEGATLYMLLLAIYNIFLSKITGQEDIVVGTPAAGRGHADLKLIIGMFVNTLALRNNLNAESTFIDFFREEKQRTLEAFENQDYPFDDLVANILSHRESGQNPIFDVMFTIQNQKEIAKGPLEMDTPVSYQADEVFDLMLSTDEYEENLAFNLVCKAGLFEDSAMERFSRYFKEILSSVLNNNQIKIMNIKISHDLYDQKLVIPGEDVDDFSF